MQFFHVINILYFRKLDCHVILLSPSELSERFPWINTDGIMLASLGKHYNRESCHSQKLRENYFIKKGQTQACRGLLVCLKGVCSTYMQYIVCSTVGL